MNTPAITRQVDSKDLEDSSVEDVSLVLSHLHCHVLYAGELLQSTHSTVRCHCTVPTIAETEQDMLGNEIKNMMKAKLNLSHLLITYLIYC